MFVEVAVVPVCEMVLAAFKFAKLREAPRENHIHAVSGFSYMLHAAWPSSSEGGLLSSSAADEAHSRPEHSGATFCTCSCVQAR